MPTQVEKLIVLYARRYYRRDDPDKEQTHWMKLGVAWRKGTDVDVVLYAMPPADARGEIRLKLKPDDGYDEARGQRNRPEVSHARDRAPSRGAPETNGDDDIPF